MKKFLLPIFVAVLALAMSVCAMAAGVVYVSDGGNGDGLTKEAPLGDLASAIQTVSGGGTINIVGTLTLDEPFTEPYHDGEIVITGGSLVFNNPKTSRYYLDGATKFEKLTITYGSENTAKSGMFVARFNPITFGEKVTSMSLIVVGGYQDPNNELEKNLDSNITINSGTFATVVGFCRGNSTVTFRGTSHITVNGGNVKNIYGASIHGSYSEASEIVINGGTVGAVYTGGDKTRRINGDAKVTVNGGTVSSVNVNNVMGHADVYYLGGRVTSMTKSVADDIAGKVEDGTVYLFVRRGVIANQFIDVFDRATYEDGSEISAASDAEVAVYAVLDKKPEKTNATGAKVYVSNAGNGDGFTPETAISDLKVAFEMLDGVDGTIVLINMVPFDEGGFYEPDHSNKIVITSYDGERYFDGGFAFGHDKYNRYFYSGDTIIENTKIEFTSAPLFIGRWHNITFGTGLEMVANKIYIVGGYQFPVSGDVPVNTGGTITIESGSYYCVIGYSRGTNAENPISFKGKQTINILGGEVNRIYGGPAQANAGDVVEINIDGGKIAGFIQVGGDQGYCSNSAFINVKSGSVKQIDMRNLLKSAVVNWTGGTIESFACDNCIYNGNRIEEAYAAANEFKDTVYTLNYSGVTPTDEMLTFFDSVASGTPVEKTVVKMTIGKSVGYVNDVEKVLDAAPIIRESRTMLPVRFVAEAFGATVGWDGATSTATVKTADVEIKITIGAKEAVVNGKTVALDAPAFIENSRTYMPVRFVAENLGAAVAWDGVTSTATLTK